jgi:hypothetical protein
MSDLVKAYRNIGCIKMPIEALLKLMEAIHGRNFQQCSPADERSDQNSCIVEQFFVNNSTIAAITTDLIAAVTFCNDMIGFHYGAFIDKDVGKYETSNMITLSVQGEMILKVILKQEDSDVHGKILQLDHTDQDEQFQKSE